MEWYAHHSDKYTEWNLYLNSIEKYFNVCKDNTVLEIAPLFGTHTNLIKHHGAKQITFVEINDNAVNAALPNTHPDCELIIGDIFSYLSTPKKFDVVVCCGLLYHLHSPLYLLELIANNIAPKFIMLETFPYNHEKMHHALVKIEENESLPDWKTSGIKLGLDQEIFIIAMKNLGYKLITSDTNITKPSNPDADLFLGVFEKI